MHVGKYLQSWRDVILRVLSRCRGPRHGTAPQVHIRAGMTTVFNVDQARQALKRDQARNKVSYLYHTVLLPAP